MLAVSAVTGKDLLADTVVTGRDLLSVTVVAVTVVTVVTGRDLLSVTVVAVTVVTGRDLLAVFLAENRFRNSLSNNKKSGNRTENTA